MDKVKALYQLTKPGIVRGNILHALAGALFASTTGFDLAKIFFVLLGTALVVASACIVNNYMDRSIDSKMARTKGRPSVTGSVSTRLAHTVAIMLLLLGGILLLLKTNLIVVVLAAIAYITYVWLYGYAKRRSVHSTLVGAIPGALPVLAGYVAISGQLTLVAWLLFLLVFIWQMPHFYAISLFRREEYKRANIPVLGVKKSFSVVRGYIFTYMVIYLAIVTFLISVRGIGVVPGVILLVATAFWMTIYVAVKQTPKDKWAKSVFGASLIVTLLFVLASLMNVFFPPIL